MIAEGATLALDRAPALRLEHVVKTFGTTRALEDATLSVRPGSVHGLLGENGAGKTTLMRVAYGLLRPDAGKILVDGEEASFRSPAAAIGAGLGMVHQHFTNVPAMTVAENIALGGRGIYSRVESADLVTSLGAATGLVLDPNALVESLPIGAQQRLEILKALAHAARILIMDEPTAVLAPAEGEELLTWLRAFADRGGAVILITHKLREALAIADDITVLRYGRAVLTTDARSTTAEALAEAMLGASAPVPAVAPAEPAADTVLRLDSVTIRDGQDVPRILDVNLELKQHEILGMVALENSGHQWLLRAIAGRAIPSSGTIVRAGNAGLIPEDRQRDAMILSFSLTENVALKGIGRAHGRVRWSSWRETTAKLLREYDVRAPSIHAHASALSGGNQQKLVLARELSDRPAIIVAENPTRGLDIRATAAVHARLRAAAASGAGVVLYSSDLDEVLSLATRIVAVHAGRLREVPNERAAAGRAMLGLS